VPATAVVVLTTTTALIDSVVQEMAAQWFSCKGCSGSDATQDTVKVDISSLLPNKENAEPNKENAEPNKENAEPNKTTDAAMKAKPAPNAFRVGQMVLVLRSNGTWSQSAVAECSPAMLTVVLQEGGQKQIPADLIDTSVKLLTEAQQKQAEADLKRRQEDERLRREAEEIAQREAAHQKAQQQEEHERLHREAVEKRQAEERREAEEKVQREAAQQREYEEAAVAASLECTRTLRAQELERLDEEASKAAADLAAAQEKVSAWCKKNGFKDATLQKKTFRGATKFPLHTAVKHKNAEVVGLLLQCGADKNALDSKKQTPGELAAKMNSKDGSHEKILAMLC